MTGLDFALWVLPGCPALAPVNTSENRCHCKKEDLDIHSCVWYICKSTVNLLSNVHEPSALTVPIWRAAYV